MEAPTPQLLRFKFEDATNGSIEFEDIIVAEGGLPLLRRLVDLFFSEHLHEQHRGLKLKGGEFAPSAAGLYELRKTEVVWPLPNAVYSEDGGEVVARIPVVDLNGIYALSFTTFSRAPAEHMVELADGR